MTFVKPEMKILTFDVRDLVVASNSCSWDCDNLTCNNVCVNDACTSGVNCPYNEYCGPLHNS